ncbi:hypothetical protein ABZV77_31045 [Streptomyces sp. NPDC004732]|uniref:hypothetical protein n=1 Tax=Streptomyces sp. NPDC004732 TaxID=3154290 RepID=UPI0033B4F9BB
MIHSAPEPSRSLPCTTTAHLPVSDGFGTAKTTAERRGGRGNALVRGSYSGMHVNGRPRQAGGPLSEDGPTPAPTPSGSMGPCPY